MNSRAWRRLAGCSDEVKSRRMRRRQLLLQLSGDGADGRRDRDEGPAGPGANIREQTHIGVPPRRRRLDGVSTLPKNLN